MSIITANVPDKICQSLITPEGWAPHYRQPFQYLIIINAHLVLPLLRMRGKFPAYKAQSITRHNQLLAT